MSGAVQLLHRRSSRRAASGAAALLLAGLSAGCASPQAEAADALPAAPQQSSADDGAASGRLVVGPAHGTLIVAGGGKLGPEILGRFVELAGGPDAHIVILPGAGNEDTFPPDWRGYALLRDVGARNLTIVHTRDRKVADTEDFTAPLGQATGVWIPGGRQWKLADAYLGTRTQRELMGVLERGGVIAGSSAGATIQGDYLVRGAPAGNTILMSPGHEKGFAFLRDIAIDQHVMTRHRENDLAQVLAAHPGLLGIAADEGTAFEIHGDTATIIGRSRAIVYDGHEHAVAPQEAKPYLVLQPGDVYDLGGRRVLRHAVP